MLIYDIAFIDKFYKAEKIDNYDTLYLFFKDYSETYYKERHIYYEEHEYIFVPIFFHFRLHLFKARESKDILSMQKEYNEALKLITNKIQFIPQEIEEVKNFCNRNKHKGKTAKKDMKMVIHLNTMKIYNSMKEASKETGFEYNSIRRCCNKYYKQCKGQFWEYYNKKVC